ncbi:MAG TPA: hypothetical protein VH740_10285 [Vicinamibacterales bacterium]|jgi:hypothetical protein
MRRGRVAKLVAVVALAAAPAWAQEPEPRPRAQNSAAVKAEESAEHRTRVRLFLDDTVFSPTLTPRLAFSAALDHRNNGPSAWGTGGSGYGKRMAARAGLVLSQAGVHHATAAALDLDPRGDQTRCGCTNPLRRAGYALGRTFVTRDRRGRAVPNVPLVAGAAGGALIAQTWYPRSDGPGRDAAQLATVTVIGQAGANLFREFAPDLKRLIRRN